MAKIFIESKRVAIDDNLNPILHLYLVYQDDSTPPNEFVIRGGPASFEVDKLIPDVTVPLMVESGVLMSESEDDRTGQDPSDFNQTLLFDDANLIEGQSVNSIWEIMKQTAKTIQSNYFGYRLVPNSNTTVQAILASVGLDIVNNIPDGTAAWQYPGLISGPFEDRPNDNPMRMSLELFGSDSGERMNGLYERNRLFGAGGDDLIFGNVFKDLLVGGTGKDRLYGGSGDDILISHGDFGDADSLFGESDKDTFEIDADDFVDGGSEYDKVTINSTNDEQKRAITSLINVEEVSGTSFDDYIQINSSDDLKIFGRTGDDFIQGGSGNDIIDGGDGDNILIGGGGDDQFKLTSKTGVSAVDGGSGQDTLFIDAYSNGQVSNLENVEIILGDTQVGSVLQLTSSSSFVGPQVLDLRTLQSNTPGIIRYENISGGAIFGDLEHNILKGNGSIDGGAGNDSIIGSGFISGGADNDYIVGTGSAVIAGDSGNDTLIGTSNLVQIQGGEGDDVIKGDGVLRYGYFGDGGDDVVENFSGEIIFDDDIDLDNIEIFGINPSDPEDPSSYTGLGFTVEGVGTLRVLDYIQVDFTFESSPGLSLNQFILNKTFYEDPQTGVGSYRQLPIEDFQANYNHEDLGYSFDGTTLNFTNGYGPSDLSFSRVGDDLYINIDGFTSGSLNFEDWFTRGDKQVTRIEFEQFFGTVYTIPDIENFVVSTADNLGDQVLFGDNFNFVGGLNKAHGSNNSDTYEFEQDAESEVEIFEEYNLNDVNVIQYNSSTAAGLEFSKSGSDLIAQTDDGKQVTRISNWFSNLNTPLIQSFSLGSQTFSSSEANLAVRTVEGGGDEDFLEGISDLDSILKGHDGDDYLKGLNGDDLLQGGEGNDRLDGGYGNDTLDGGAGDDVLVSGPGGGWGDINTLDGGSGNDVLVQDGGSTGSTFVGGLGIDTFTTSNVTTAIIDLAAGVFTTNGGVVSSISGVENVSISSQGLANVTGNGLANIIVTGSGFGTIDGGGGADQIYAGSGDDLIYFHGTESLIDGGEGNDTIKVASTLGATLDINNPIFSNIETLEGNDGDDTLIGNNQANTFSGGLGNDTIYGGDGDDTIDGGAGNDVLHTGSGVDNVFTGDGTNTVHAEGGSNFIFSGTGNDTLYVTGADNVSDSGGIDTVYVNDANGFTGYLEGIENAIGGDGDDDLHAREGAALNYDGGLGNDSVRGDYLNDFADTLHGGDGNDTISGYGGDDELYGDEGDDTLRGGDGIDTLYGGTGVDYMEGNSGDDTLDGGDGDDRIFGNEGNDTLYGGLGDDQLDGGDGDDTLSDLEGNNSSVRGGAGNDIINTGTGADFVFGDSGNDVIVDLGGQNLIEGGDGDDSITSGDDGSQLRGGAGHDVITAGAGDDTITGGAGNDTINFGAGSNNVNFNIGDGVDSIAYGDKQQGSVNKLFLADANLPDVMTSVVDNQLEVLVGTGGDKVLISANAAGDDFAIDEIHLFDGTIIQTSDLLGGGSSAITGTEGDDSLYGTAGDDVIDGLGGNDSLVGGDGADTLIGGDGNDTFEVDGLDTVDGGSGFDTVNVVDANGVSLDLTTSSIEIVNGSSGNDTLTVGDDGGIFVYGNDGDDTLTTGSGDNDIQGGAGADSIYAGAGSDTIRGGTGSDFLSGQSGSDTYIFNAGDGQDFIFDVIANGTGDFNMVMFGSGITDADTTFTQENDNLVITFASNPSDKITVLNWFIGVDGNGDDHKSIAQFIFDNGAGTTLTTADIDAMFSGGSSTITGTEGDDSLFGTAGDDVIEGLGGNDYLAGGYGSDTYVYNLGDGADSILSTENISQSDVNTLLLGAGIIEANTVFEQIGNDLRITFTNSPTDSITLFGWYLGEQGNGDFYDSIDQVVFDDGNGATLTTSDIAARVIYESQNIVTSNGDDQITTSGGDDVIDSGAGNDTIYSGAGDDEIEARDGDDTVYAGEGDDNVQAGYGNDTLYGGIGNDILNGEYGDDYIDGGEGNNRLWGGAGNDTLIGHDGDDIIAAGIGDDIINAGDGNNTINAGSGVNHITTGSGNDSIIGGQDNDTITSGDGNDTIEALGGDNIIIAGSGDKIITAEDGNSSIPDGNNEITVGDGTNSITTGDGIDIITSGAGEDEIRTNGGNDTVYSGAGDDDIRTDEGDDVIYAGDGDDYVNAGVDDDYIDGGLGNNYLHGSGGNDTIIAYGGDDTIHTGSGNDTVDAGEGHNDVFATSGTNHITTGSGNDFIRGGQGADTIISGDGNDTVEAKGGDNIIQAGNGDKTITALDGSSQIPDGNNQITLGDGLNSIITGDGIDTITSGAGVDTIESGGGDDVISAGAGNDDITADDGNDTIHAGDGDDFVSGGYGNDQITGGTGNDILYGNAGDDIYNFARNDGQDFVMDTAGAADALNFLGDIDHDQLWFSQDGYNLNISVVGTADDVTISGWFANSSRVIETMTTGDGYSLGSSDIAQLVQAMAAFSPPAMGQTEIDQTTLDQLAPTLTSTWQQQSV